MDLRESIKNQVDVSLTLAKHVFSTEVKPDSNLVFSPLSINIILGLIAAGSKGPTLDQLLGFLKSKSTDDLNAFSSQIVTVIFSDGSPIGGPRLSVANGAWIDQTWSFKPSFKHVVDSVYNAVSESVDFQHKASEVANQVNLWAEKETGGLIKEILPGGAVNNTTRLVFANALYFKGAWTEKFNASDTTDQEFHLLNGSSVQVPFMSSKKKQYVKAFKGFKVLGLPYEQGEDKRHFSMYFFLPDAQDGLPSLMDKVTSESGFLERHLPGHAVSVASFVSQNSKYPSALKLQGFLLRSSVWCHLSLARVSLKWWTPPWEMASTFREFSTRPLLRLMRKVQQLQLLLMLCWRAYAG